MGYLLSDAVELGQDVEEGHLGDNELLLLVLVQGGGREVQRQVHKSGLHHRLLVLIIVKQLLFFFCWLEMSDKKKEGRSGRRVENITDKRNHVSISFTSFNIEVNQEGCRRDWAAHVQLHNLFVLLLFGGDGGAVPVACGSSRARDQTRSAAVTQVAAVTTLDP